MGARRGPNQLMNLAYSDIVAVATEIELTGLRTDLAHCFAGVQFFDDALGATSALPSAGSVDITVGTINNDPNYEPAPVSTIDATAPDTSSWAGNTTKVKATPTGITGASYWRICVTQNET